MFCKHLEYVNAVFDSIASLSYVCLERMHNLNFVWQQEHLGNGLLASMSFLV